MHTCVLRGCLNLFLVVYVGVMDAASRVSVGVQGLRMLLAERSRTMRHSPAVRTLNLHLCGARMLSGSVRNRLVIQLWRSQSEIVFQ